MIQADLSVSESALDVGAFSGEFKDTAFLLSIPWNPSGDRSNSAEQHNVPSFNFREYNRVYAILTSGINGGVLSLNGPISVITWALPGGVRAKDEIKETYSHCVNLMLRF